MTLITASIVHTVALNMEKLAAVVSVAAIVGCAAPALSAPLRNWQFDPATNQLELTVPAGVKPQVFLLNQPDRIIVNLPSTQIGGVMPEATYNGAIRQIQVSQFQPQLARIVLELAPNVRFNVRQARLQQVKESNPGFDRWVFRPALISGSANTASAKTQAVFSDLRPAQTNRTAQAPSLYDLPPAPSLDAPIGGSATPTINAPQIPASAPLVPASNPGSSLLFPDAKPLPSAKPAEVPATGRSLALPEVNPSLAIPDSFPAINAPSSAPTVSVPPLERRSPVADQPMPKPARSVEPIQEPMQSEALTADESAKPAQTRPQVQSGGRVSGASRVIEFGQPLPTAETP